MGRSGQCYKQMEGGVREMNGEPSGVNLTLFGLQKYATILRRSN